MNRLTLRSSASTLRSPRTFSVHEWYICRGFCFWQGDLDAPSGAAERVFSFGQIKPAGDFNGDGLANGLDLTDFDAQYLIWHDHIPPANEVLTYYHGDLNSDGLVNQTDWDIAHVGSPPAIPPLIGNATWPFNNNTWYLGDPDTHVMTWSPNEPNPKWLPCCCPTGGTSGPASMGPP